VPENPAGLESVGGYVLEAVKQVFAISVVVAAIAGGLVLARAQSRVAREGPDWVRIVTGSLGSNTFKDVRVETVGNVILRGDNSGRSEYTFKARVRARDQREAQELLEDVEVRTSIEGERARITVRSAPGISESSELAVTLPRVVRQVSVVTKGGNVQASDLDGAVEARSAGGRIVVNAVRGSAEIRTGGGSIQVDGVGGALRCSSGGGSIRVQNAGGESWLETAGGEIFVSQAMAPVHAMAQGNIRIEHVAGPVYAGTSGGLIDVRQAQGVVTAESSGGAIQVNAAKGVHCESAGGAIRLRNVAGAMHASTNAGSILAELIPGGRLEDSMLSTRAGDITITIPSNVAVTIEAMNGWPGAGRILSDFPEIRVRGDSRQGGAPVVADGALNGGGPVLHVSAAAGTIYLRKQK